MMFFDRCSIFFSVSILREYADSTMCCCQCRVEFVEIRPVREVALLFTYERYLYAMSIQRWTRRGYSLLKRKSLYIDGGV